jgi:formate dehydrogenase maturation protein FdhE
MIDNSVAFGNQNSFEHVSSFAEIFLKYILKLVKVAQEPACSGACNASMLEAGEVQGRRPCHNMCNSDWCVTGGFFHNA